MRIAVIGVGHVGGTVRARLTRAGCDVVAFDKRTAEPYPEEDLRACEFAVICVGTPRGEDGAADLDDVTEAVLRTPCPNLLLHSTVPPGTTEALEEKSGKNICFSPEYVGESAFLTGSWAADEESAFVILGGRPEVRRFFLDRLLPVYGPVTRYFQCSSAEAEVIKYMENCYFAAKVTFVNEFYDLCRALDLDWHTVREGWLLDARIARDHSAVFPDRRGFGGRCLPKDVDALLAFGAAAGIPLPLLAAVRECNQQFTGAAQRQLPGQGH